MSGRHKSQVKIAADWAAASLKADAERGCVTMFVAIPIPAVLHELLRDDDAFNELLQIEFRECVQRLVEDKARAVLREFTP
jgi:hypothetical protein